MTHTWDLHLSYYACPKCSYILENRKNFKGAKEFKCPKCHHCYLGNKSSHKKSSNHEFDWS